MSQSNFPIIIQQGVSYLQPFYYFNENGQPIDLTGCSARMQGRPTVNSENPPLFDWSSEDNQISIQGPQGCVMVYVSAEDTAALDQYCQGVYDLLLTFPSGLVEQLVAGPVSIVGRITRDE